MSELSSINSPSDLQRYNDSIKPVDPVKTILEQVYDCGPVVGKAIAEDILDTLVDWHERCYQDMLKDGEPEKAIVWNEDYIKLTMALEIVRGVAV